MKKRFVLFTVIAIMVIGIGYSVIRTEATRPETGSVQASQKPAKSKKDCSCCDTMNRAMERVRKRMEAEKSENAAAAKTQTVVKTQTADAKDNHP